jgi:hypothetical protein
MRLFVTCPQDAQKIYLNYNAPTRDQLPSPVIVRCPFACGRTYSYPPDGVFAEALVGGGIGGAVAGGLIGLIGGPIGLLAGLLLGGAAGGSAEANDQQAAQRFNTSGGGRW